MELTKTLKEISGNELPIGVSEKPQNIPGYLEGHKNVQGCAHAEERSEKAPISHL